MHIKANGLNFSYTIDGPQGAPWIVFSNSLCTTGAMWDEQAAALKSKYQVLRYDQRGHGATDAPAGRYAFDTLVADAVALLDALSIGRTHVAGLSMGGATALGLAEQHPDRVDRVIVCDSPCMSTPASSAQWEERIVVAQRHGMEALVEPTIGRWFPPEVVAAKPPVLDKVRQMIRSTPIAGFSGCAQALSDYDLRPGLAGIDRRTLLIVGTKDATLGGIRQIKEAVNGAALVELEGAGHISNVEQPAAFSGAIREFLNQA
jgi:3-oxoadipate enol-lactonase